MRKTWGKLWQTCSKDKLLSAAMSRGGINKVSPAILSQGGRSTVYDHVLQAWCSICSPFVGQNGELVKRLSQSGRHWLGFGRSSRSGIGLTVKERALPAVMDDLNKLYQIQPNKEPCSPCLGVQGAIY